ncbi:hypothetical protein HPB47_018969, partial [Ixodes persulcatus]
EFKNAVFNAAKDGKLKRLKVFLDHRPKEEVEMLVSATTNGATPLVMASRNGHLEVADYLLEKCHADIEQVGSVTFEGETIEGAPPLWCAAAAGHLGVVQGLVSRGARGADLEIANRHGHTCLMIACYKGHLDIAAYLVSRGAHVDRKSAKGNTALHDCAESGSLEILRLLLEHGAKAERDAYGLTPLLAAAVTGHASVVEFLAALPDCPRDQRVEARALELLGATYVDKRRDSPRALSLWRRALAERCTEPPLPKPRRAPAAAYGDAVEASSLADLEDLLCEPDHMRMQSTFKVLERKHVGDTEELGASEMLVSMGGSLEEFYPAMVVSTLMRIMRDPTLGQHHTNVVQAVVFIFKSLGLRCVPYVPQVLPSLLNVVRTVDNSFREFLFQQLAQLIAIEFWIVNSPIQSTIIMLVEQIVMSLGPDFKMYLPKLVPHALKVFMHDMSADRAVTAKLLMALQKFGCNLDDYLHLILPPIIKLFDSADIPMNVRITALETIDVLSESLDFSEFAARIIHPHRPHPGHNPRAAL